MAKSIVPAEAASAEVTPAEFTKIPLDFIIATPLLTTIEAHKAAANTTLDFITKLKDSNTTFKIKVNEIDGDGKLSTVDREINVPLLSIVKVPSLNFDSLSVAFNFNISQIIKETESSGQNGNINVGAKFGPFVNASLTGSIEHNRSRENVVNRGGSLEVKLHVSETQIPAGLEKIINAMVESIEIPVK